MIMHSSSSSTTTTTMILMVATLLCFVAPQKGSAWVPSAAFFPSHRLLDKRSQQPLFVSSALTTTTRNRPAGPAEVVPDSTNDFRDDNNNALNYYGNNAYEDDTYNDYLSLEEEEEELLLAEEEEEEERLAEEEELREEEEILASGGELVPFETDDGEVFVAATRGDMIPFLEEEEEERLLLEEEEMDRMYYNDEERDMSMMYDEPVSPFDRFSSFVGETTNALVSGTMGLLSRPWLFTTTTPAFIETMDIMESNTIMANNIDVQPLLEEAEDILNDDENCLHFLGDDIEIGPVFSQSTLETSRNGNVRQETVLQASVQGSEEGEATVEIIAVDGGVIEEMLVQLEDGTEINLPGIAAMDEDYYEDEMEEEILAEEEDILAEEEEEIEEEEMRRNQFR